MQELDLVKRTILSEQQKFQRSYEYINKNRFTRWGTVQEHLEIITKSLENSWKLIQYTEYVTE